MMSDSIQNGIPDRSSSGLTLDRCGVRIISGQCVQRSGLPPWKRRLEHQIRKWRKKARVLGNIVVKDKTKKRALEVAEQRLMALTGRLQRYSKDADTKRINHLFTAEPSRVYSMLRGDTGIQPDTTQGGDWKVLGGHLGHRRHAQCIC